MPIAIFKPTIGIVIANAINLNVIARVIVRVLVSIVTPK
jgi:hypothetical protein